jgi:hypothetical protein
MIVSLSHPGRIADAILGDHIRAATRDDINPSTETGSVVHLNQFDIGLHSILHHATPRPEGSLTSADIIHLGTEAANEFLLSAGKSAPSGAFSHDAPTWNNVKQDQDRERGIQEEKDALAKREVAEQEKLIEAGKTNLEREATEMIRRHKNTFRVLSDPNLKGIHLSADGSGWRFDTPYLECLRPATRQAMREPEWISVRFIGWLQKGEIVLG